MILFTGNHRKNLSTIVMSGLFRSLQTFVLFTILCSCLGYVCNGCSRKASYTEVQPNITLVVDGGWEGWSSWSSCSHECIYRVESEDTPVQIRTRQCTLPSPYNGGKYCEGIWKATKDCSHGLEKCPEPVDGYWTEWGDWGPCPATCYIPGQLVQRYRSRGCNKPVHGGKPCPGSTYELLKCVDLPRCTTDGSWSEWRSYECIPDPKDQLCSRGYDIQNRSCDNPAPHNGADCPGSPRRVMDCWSRKGCPVNIQPPMNVTHRRIRDSVVISWWRPPYGEPLKYFVLYMGIKFGLVVDYKIPLRDPQPLGEYYNYTVNRLESPEISYVYNVTSYGYNDNSAESKGDIFRTGEIDGAWGNWGHWDVCSSNCLNQAGAEIRRRICNNPEPSNRGKHCPGEPQESQRCWGANSCN